MEIKPHNFLVLSLSSHLIEMFSTTTFNFNEFIFVYIVNIRFVMPKCTYLFADSRMSEHRSYFFEP